jgi:AraC-like DNA-binding protein
MSDYIFNFHDTVLLATAFQSLLFILLILLVKHERHISDLFLIGFFIAQISITIHILLNYSLEIRFLGVLESPNLLHTFDIAYWLEGPLLLWYTRSILYKNFTITKNDAWYLLPTLIYFIYILFVFYSVGDADKIEYLAREKAATAPSIHHGVEALRECLRVVFGMLCLIDIRRARSDLRDRFSNIEKIDIGWLSILVIAFTTVRVWILIVVSAALLIPSLGESIFNAMGLAGNYLTFALITSLMFLSLQRSSIFDGHMTEEDTAVVPEEQDINPELAKKIENHMVVEKPYLMHLLNLEQLASQLSMHPRALSVAIKKHFKTNFYEFVNSYRINEAKSILSNPLEKHKTMIEISGDCGFNSKATYNSFFKKLVGMTPTQYRSEKLSSS